MQSWSLQNSALCQVPPMIPSLPSVYLQFQPLPGALASDTYLPLNISTWIFKMHLKLNMCKATSGCPPPPWLPNLSPSLKWQHHPSRCLCPKYLELFFDSFSSLSTAVNPRESSVGTTYKNTSWTQWLLLTAILQRGPGHPHLSPRPLTSLHWLLPFLSCCLTVYFIISR